jgi:hypothetical protein
LSGLTGNDCKNLEINAEPALHEESSATVFSSNDLKIVLCTQNCSDMNENSVSLRQVFGEFTFSLGKKSQLWGSPGVSRDNYHG